MKRLIIVGSPRANGRSAHLAEMLFEANIDEHPEDELFLVPLSEVEVGPCIACNACRKKSGVILKGESGEEVTVQRHRCIFDDDMQTLYDLIDEVDEVSLVSPVFFSGAPAQMKCLLDRLQPYFWARMELKESGSPLPDKRPLVLHVIGEGGDPHGYDALVSEVKASFAVADFRLDRILDWVGKISEDGEVVAEAKEVVFGEGGKKQRAKLDLSASGNNAGRGAADEASGQGTSKEAASGKNADKRDASGKAAARKAAPRGNAARRGTSKQAVKKSAAKQGTKKKGGSRGR